MTSDGHQRLKKAAGLLLDEFLSVADATEAAQCVADIGDATLHADLVKSILVLAMDRSDRDHIRVAGLLASLHVRGAIQGEQIECGFELVAKGLRDLLVDVPKAADIYAQFLANAVVDKIIPENFLEQLVGLVGDDVLGGQILESVRKHIDLPLPSTRIKGQVKIILDELFSSGEVPEAAHSVFDLDASQFGHEVVKRAVSLAMEKGPAEREYVSKLLVALVEKECTTVDQIMEGFVRLLGRIDDLALDVPDVATQLANFIARAIVDEVVPPAFLSLAPPSLLASGRGAEVAGLVKVAVQRNHAASRLATVWGPGTGKPVEELKTLIAQLVEEFLSCGDTVEAARCITDLASPMFHHEVVKRLLVLSLERAEKDRALAVTLLIFTARNDVISRRQLHQGFARVVMALDDLSLDIPDVAPKLTTIVDQLASANVLSVTFRSHVWGSKARCGTRESVRAATGLILDEFCLLADSAEAALCVSNLRAPHLLGEMVHQMLWLSMDRDAQRRTMCSKLISSLHVRWVLTVAHVTEGFELLLKDLPDLVLDAPNAEEVAAELIAVAIEDKCLSESFLAAINELTASPETAASIAAHVKAKVDLPLPGTKARRSTLSALEEMFSSGDIDEAVLCIKELGLPLFGHEVVKLSITVALERQERERELVSQLILKLSDEGVTPPDQIMEGFIRVLARIDDLALDTPSAVAVVSAFLARAITDEVIPRHFLSLLPSNVESSPLGAEVARSVRVAVGLPHASSRLTSVWGPGTGRPVSQLKDAVAQTILEYLDSGDLQEAVRCVKELNEPLFGHEVVKKLVTTTLERARGDDEQAQCVRLIGELLRQEAITSAQTNKGITRVILALPDLSLDVPEAPALLQGLVSRLLSAEAVTAEVAAALTTASALTPASA